MLINMRSYSQQAEANENKRLKKNKERKSRF
jgi:hypothetical protein